MRSKEDILYDGNNVTGYASNKLLLEVLLDIREQNEEIKEKLNKILFK